MVSKKMNVLVYSGNGSTVESVRHCLYTFRRLLSPSYAVITVTGDAIIKEPWRSSCALLVFPGGADLPYCHTLNGEGNRMISQYVERGGRYLGLCAGGYYASQRCEFEIGRKGMEVVGNRELAFYPGTCRGCAFPGFVYNSERGMKAAEIQVSKTAFTKGSIPAKLRTYYNGGGVFVDAPRLQDKGIEILATYTEELSVDAGEGTAAVVYCKVDNGAAILTSNHPEFAAVNLGRESDERVAGYDKVVEALADDDKQRIDFLKACLWKLGLEVNQDQNAVPSLSRLHLSSYLPAATSELLASLSGIITTKNSQEFIEDEADTFLLERASVGSLGFMNETHPVSEKGKADEETWDEDRFIDYNTIVKHVVVHDDGLPRSKETPCFNHQAYFANLKHYQSSSKEGNDDIGHHILYGEVVTSTNTLLEKNTQLLRHLPNGFTATATVQVAGRGRGTNVWVSPPGSLMFSTVIRHPMWLQPTAPIVFLQYLAALAVVEGIKTYEQGFQRMPVKLKWPNDIYAQDPSDSTGTSYVKIGGILVNSHYSSEEYLSVIGIGLNTTNHAPTTSLNALNPPTPLTMEKLLACIIVRFSDLYARFVRTGFDKEFEEMYYTHWLHMDQVVTLENEGGVRARIKGVTRDWGLLIAEELGWEDRATGKMWTLQSDSNSFDFFKGLIKRKV